MAAFLSNIIASLKHRSRDSPAKPSPIARAPKKLGFTDLPLEVRTPIFNYLLIDTRPILYPGRLVQSKRQFGVDSLEHPDLGVAILQTCHQVYEEGLSVLYGRNKFVFESAECIEAFHFAGLATVHTTKITRPIFGLKPQPHGRLTLIKSMVILFKLTGRETTYSDLRRTWILRDWQSFFNEKPSESPYHFDGKGFARFPALEELGLDFRGLELNGEGLTTAPVVRKFATTHKLKQLKVEGVKHEATLVRLKAGLVRDDGDFVAIAM